ncbi:MAG: DUF432 domain-containing protein [Calditrichaeota bacterium]|nr:MAG: DUF432 domain-containing protein [Calditrichota bacterium]
MNKFYSEISLQEGKEEILEFGDFKFTLILKNEVLEVVSQKGETLETKIFALKESKATICLKPAFYDRPFTIKFLNKIELAKVERITFFVKLPIYHDLVLKVSNKTIILGSTKSLKLNLTSLGEVTKAVLCYFKQSEIGFDHSEMITDFAEALIPLSITNKNEELHELTKVIIYHENLGIFAKDEKLFTNEIKITLLREEEISLTYSSRTVVSDSNNLISAKEEKINHSFFSLLPGIGKRGAAKDYGF